ncbi:T9SS type A sorting domain-containing protein [Algoriphagus marinus]|uniref:T9SS type A sorting domain-containing protein n=1 Tax=Algoriphagus marinus TaxID=1925762 RepID=UPI00094BA725|nr:T9SS type A sorting domain-containing protein [Algoriphagus marinus]
MSRLILIGLFLLFQQVCFGQTWIGVTSTNWNTASNWSPANVPGTNSDVIINNPTAPNQPILPGNISIRDLTITNGALSLSGFTLTVTRNGTISGGSISNGTLNVRDYNALQNTTFNGNITLIKTGSNNDDTAGGNIYNGPTTIRNNDNSRWRHANLNGDTFNSTVTFIKASSGDLQIAFNGSTIFNGQVTINNLNGGGTLSIGLGSGTSTLNAGGLITSSFALGNLDIRNLTQTTNTPNGTFSPTLFTIGNSTLLGNFNLTAANGITVLGNNRFCTGAGSLCTIVKNGGGNNDWVGGNTFGTVSITNNSNSRLRLANSGGGDTFNSSSTFTNTGTNFLGIAFSGTNTFAQQITINNSNANGEVRFGEGGGTSTLATGGVVTSGFSVGTLLEFNNFTQVQNSPNGNFGVTTFTSINSSFQGDFGVTATTINFTQANTFARNGTFTAANINMTQAGNSFATAGGSVTFTKTGGGTNQWNGGNTFGIVTVINNSNLLFRLGANTGDTFNSTSTFTNTGTNFLGIAFRGTNTFAQQITINNSSANGEVRFGEGGGTSTLATGGVVTSGFSVGNILEFNNFIQVQNSPNGNFGVTTFTSINSSFQGSIGVNATTFTSDNSVFQRDITVTATTINFTRANTFARNGTFTATNFTQTIAGSSFATAGGAVTFTKNGGAANTWYGGNTFGTFTFINNSNSTLRLANNVGDTFISTSVFSNNGTNFIDIAYRGANTFAQQISLNNSNAAGSIRFGEVTASSTSNLITGGIVTSGFTTGALLEFNNFTQSQNAPNGSFAVTTFTSASSSFQGDFEVTATTINFTQANTFARNGTFTAANINMTQAGNSFATAGGSVTFTKTGGGTNQWNGGNTFGIVTVINNSNTILRLGTNAGDTFNSTSTFTNTGTNFLGIAYRGTNTFAQQITINNSNANGEVRFGEGGGTSTLATGGVVTSGFSVGNILEFNNFTQVQNSPNGNFGVTTFTSVNSSFQGDFGVTATTINFTQANTFARNGTFTAANINMTQAGNSFATTSGTANFTKTGGAANNWFGGNSFGTTIITNNSNSNLRLANNNGDTFNRNATFIKSGSGNIEPAYNGITSFRGNISTVGSNASIFFAEGNGTVLIDGNTSQLWEGNLAQPPIAELVQMNTSGTLTLNVPLQIDQSLTFSSGFINTTNTNTLTFIDNATSVGASDVSYVDGPVTKIGNDNFEFPIGKSGSYAPSTVGGGGGTSDSYSSEYFAIAPVNIPTDTVGKDPTIGLMNQSEHWSFTRNTGTVARSLALSYNSTRTSPIIDHTELLLINWDGSAWKDLGGTVSGSATSGTVTRGSNSTFGLLSIASSFRILPIELLEFKAEETSDKNIKVIWVTATEKNNAFFTLEKSFDGKTWETIALIPGSGNSLEQRTYDFIDKDVRYGRQFYRLTQTDFDGRFETFQVIGISLIEDQSISPVYTVYPNPSTGRFTLQGESMNLDKTALEIFDLNGNLVLKNSDMKNKRQEFDLSSLPKGIYVLKLFSLQGLVTKKLIIH